MCWQRVHALHVIEDSRVAQRASNLVGLHTPQSSTTLIRSRSSSITLSNCAYAIRITVCGSASANFSARRRFPCFTRLKWSHSRLKSFLFCKSSLPQPFFFSFRIHYMDFPYCLLLLLRISVFLLFSFSVFTHFYLSVPCGRSSWLMSAFERTLK